MDRRILKLLIAFVLLLTANIGIFTLGSDFATTFWISYVYAMIAAIISIYVLIFSSVKEKLLFRYPIQAVTCVYLGIELVAAFFVTQLLSFKPLFAFLVQLVILSLYIVGLLSVMVNNSFIQEQQQIRGTDIANFEYIVNLMKEVVSKVPYADPDRKTIQHAADCVASGQVRSGEAVYDLEQKMISQIEELKAAVSEKNREKVLAACSSIESSAEERKRILSQRAKF